MDYKKDNHSVRTNLIKNQKHMHSIDHGNSATHSNEQSLHSTTSSHHNQVNQPKRLTTNKQIQSITPNHITNHITKRVEANSLRLTSQPSQVCLQNTQSVQLTDESSRSSASNGCQLPEKKMSDFLKRATFEREIFKALESPDFAAKQLNLHSKEQSMCLGLATQSSDSSNNDTQTSAKQQRTNKQMENFNEKMSIVLNDTSLNQSNINVPKYHPDVNYAQLVQSQLATLTCLQKQLDIMNQEYSNQVDQFLMEQNTHQKFENHQTEILKPKAMGIGLPTDLSQHPEPVTAISRSISNDTESPQNSFSKKRDCKADLKTIFKTAVQVNQAQNIERSQLSQQCGNKLVQTREKKKTKRRTANQIEKQYQCLFCSKRFGSEAANIMHMRKKHNMGTKTDMLRDGERKLIGFDPLSIMAPVSLQNKQGAPPCVTSNQLPQGMSMTVAPKKLQGQVVSQSGVFQLLR